MNTRGWSGVGVFLLLSACSPSDDPPPCGGEGILCHVAGTPRAPGFNGDGLAAEDTALDLPSAVREGPDGLLYVMDFNNMRLRCRIGSGVVDTIAGNGVHAFAFQNAAALESPFENPIDFDFFADGRVVLVSLHDPRVLTVDFDGTLRVLAGTGDAGDGGDGRPADEAVFNELAALALAPDGSIFVSDDVSHRVRVIRPDGKVYAYAGTGDEGDGGDGGLALEAQLFHPEGLALDDAGNLFIADTYNHRIRRVDAASGSIETVAGTGESGLSGDGGLATSAKLNFPRGVRVAPDGRLYVADTFNHRVRRIELDGTIETVAGSSKGYGGDGALAVDAQLRGPAHIEVTDDTLYIPDQQNQVVRAMQLPLTP